MLIFGKQQTFRINAMKTKTLLLLVTLFSSVIFGQEYKTLTSDGKLRKGRSILSSVITTISEGTKVEIVYKSHEKGYYRVLYKNLNGYLHEKHFEASASIQQKNKILTGKVIFIEDFNNNKNKWRESKNDTKEFFFKNGEYFIVQRDNGRLTWESKNVEIDTDKDFSIETSVTLHLKKNGGAHLLYGMNEDAHNYYSVKIKNEKGKKEVFIGKYLNGEWIGVWKDGFISKFGKPNLIQISKKGSEISFYINRIFIETKKFESFFGNFIGLGSEGVQNASFDYLTIKQGTQKFVADKKVNTTRKEVITYSTLTTVKLNKYNGVYNIPITMNESLEVNAIFEEGASDIMLSPDVALTLLKTGTVGDGDWLKGPSFEFSDGTIANTNKFKLTSLKIGNKTINNVTCSISDYMKVPMILGKNILKRYGKYSFDYVNETLTIGNN